MKTRAGAITRAVIAPVLVSFVRREEGVLSLRMIKTTLIYLLVWKEGGGRRIFALR